MRPDQKAMLKSLWTRGLMKIDPRCPRLCALMEEAEGVGLSPDQVKAFVKRMRRETGMNHWGREEIDLTVFIALTVLRRRFLCGRLIDQSRPWVRLGIRGLQPALR
ncbi:uncharacterized protein LOC144912769 [Branchiostoma floridae x Branchiostoma belcheri]